jgi:hypothetical protein
MLGEASSEWMLISELLTRDINATSPLILFIVEKSLHGCDINDFLLDVNTLKLLHHESYSFGPNDVCPVSIFSILDFSIGRQ